MDDYKTILEELLCPYFAGLDNQKIEYCVIGNYVQLPKFTSNDVDFWVEDHQAALQLLYTCAKNAGLKLYMQNETASGSNNYFYKVVSEEIEIVKIDLMTETAYKSLFPLVSGDMIKNNRIMFNGFYVANSLVEGVMHLLYPLVAFGIVKEKYKNKLLDLANDTIFYEAISSTLGTKLTDVIFESIRDENWFAVERYSSKVKKKIIFDTVIGLDKKRLKVLFYFVRSIFSRIVAKNGLVIGFTGIDGAGKSSVKEELIRQSDQSFAKGRTRDFYWRPFLLPPIARALKIKGQPEKYDESGRRLVKSSILSSFKDWLKYSYYLVDYILGQGRYFINSHTGGLVIFDRYHLDNIIYPQRFGFSLNKKVMRFVDRYVVPQPDILFYFTADTEILFNRKHEIDIEEIEHQKSLYSKEIDLRPSVVIIATDSTFESTLTEVKLYCFELMASRYLHD